MIEHLEIINYRSCESASFQPKSELSILIGPNGSGKTNILNAIILLRSLANGSEYYDHDEHPANECTLKATFKFDGKKIKLVATIGLDTDGNNRDVVMISHEKWYMRDFTGSKRWVRHPVSLRELYRYQKRFPHYPGSPPQSVFDSIEYKTIHSVASYLSDIKYYSASQFTNPASCPVSFEIEKEGPRRRGVRLSGHAKFLYDLYTAYKNSNNADYKSFFDIVGPDGIGLIDGITFKEISTSSIEYTVRSGAKVRKQTKEKLLIVPQFDIGRSNLSPNQLSEGTFKTITLLFYVITESSTLLLIEEPEVCVHHGLLSSIVELIKVYSSEKQIIVSTHSDFVLDKVKSECVFKVTRSAKEGTKIAAISSKLTKPELIALKKYLEEDGNLGEYWRHGGLD